VSAGAADHDPVREETPTTYYEERVRIPGQGEPPERCRGLSPVGFCEAGHTILGRSSCGTRYCPDHWRDWIEEAVVNLVARLGAYREAVDGAEKRLSHVVASPPQDRRYSVRQLWESRSEAYEALQDAAVRGGVTVTHPYRTNERGNLVYETAREAGDVEEGTGRWRFLRETADDWEELSGYVEASPHYHALAAGPEIASEAAPEEWIVERVRTLSRWHRNDIESYRDMVRVAYYVLTHGGVQEGRQSVTYFGDVHPGAFDPADELTATAWARIQEMAEEAVKGAEEDRTGVGPEECPREECEAVVKSLAYLDEYLDDPEWSQKVRSQRGGYTRWLRLIGAREWKAGMTDRPPPGARVDADRMLEWLEQRGRTVTPEPSQAGLGGFA